MTKERYKPGDTVRKLTPDLEYFEFVGEFFAGFTMSAVITEGNGNADTSPSANTSREAIIALLGKREKPIRLLKRFSEATTVTRQMLAGVQNKVSLYTELKSLDVQLDRLHSEWLDTCAIIV